MATVEQIPSMPRMREADENRNENRNLAVNPLDSVLARAYTLNWEVIFYVLLLIAAVLSRLVNLGDRVMSHDESLHVKYSQELYQRGIFQHTPLMHGPVLFHMTALMYFLFGDSDFSGRLYPAFLGIAMVFFPKLLFERWLGKLGAMVASVLLLISPMVLYHHRYIREDTPSIFYTLLMIYAVFAYVDGKNTGKLRWLMLLAGAMLLSLASKEVAFMYIAIFGLILTIFWLVQLVQGLRAGETSPLVGWVVGGVVGVIALAGISLLLGLGLSGLLGSLLGQQISVGILTAAVFLLLLAGAAFFFRPLRNMIGTLGEHAVSFYKLILSGSIVGIAAALPCIAVLAIIPPTAQPDPITANRQFIWTLMAIAPFVIMVLGTAMARFSGSIWLAIITTAVMSAFPLMFILNVPTLPLIFLSLALLLALWLAAGVFRPAGEGPAPWGDLVLCMAIVAVVIGMGLVLFVFSLNLQARILICFGLLAILWFLGIFVRGTLPTRLPWGDIATVLLVALIWCIAVVTIEERTRTVPNVSAEKGAVVPEGGYRDIYIWASWGVAFIVCGGLLYLRYFTNFFEELKRYPIFDVLMVMGTLVLPWLAAVPIFFAGYPLDSNYVDGSLISACIRGGLPFLAVSFVAGWCWNPRAFALSAAVFYSIFVFFFTTIFTNMYGLLTGVIGSLGYWLAQQGVRRGSQPQYYYLLVELPIYEYLPLIGGLVAGVFGMLGVWQFRRDRIEEGQYEVRASLNEAGTGLSELGAEALPDSDLPSVDEMAHSAAAAEGFQRVAEHESAAEPVREPIAESTAEGAPDGLMGAAASADVLPEMMSDAPDMTPSPTGRPINPAEMLDHIPFLSFVGWWGVLMILALTLSGEKMPWLTTHLTVPLIFATAYYLGKLLEKVDWDGFRRVGWGLIGLIPLIGIALANVVGPFVFGNIPFMGIERENLLRTFTWMGAILVTGLLGYGVYYIWRRLGTQQTLRVAWLGVFVLLGVLTARTAWTAAFINYDSAREFLVYAHGAPASKTIMNTIEEISKRTTDGMSVRVAYDNEISWPGSWYFRNYTNARYLGDQPQQTPDLDTHLVVVIGSNNNPKVEAMLAEKYYKTKLIRLWWPMQDYFDLNRERVESALGDPAVRQGMWEIWWNRDYTDYARATKKANLMPESEWPVADWMYFYVRKDIAAQVWDFGTGSVKLGSPFEDPFSKAQCATCQANLTFGTSGTEPGQLNRPHGITVGPDGNIYVMDSQNTRVQVFDPDGKPLRQFGAYGSVDDGAQGGVFREPWGITVDRNGNIIIADTWNHRVQVFDKNGQFVRMWGKFDQVTVSTSNRPESLYGPRDIAVDSSGNIYVADTGNKRIRVYSADGTYQRNIGQDMLNEPVGIAINSELKEIYIADTWNKRIQVYSLDGNPVRSWNVQAWSQTTESGNRPYMTLDKTGTMLFVTDPDNNRVMVFNTQGKPITSFTRKGSILSGIAVDSTGRIYIVDTNNNTIVRYATSEIPDLNPPVITQPQQGQPEAPTREDF